MPIQYTPACTNRLDLIGRLVGQIHGMAYGCHQFSEEALVELQANLEEMVDFATNPEITGCDPKALAFIDFNGVGPLHEMLKEVTSLLEREQQLPKQYVDNSLASTTIGDIESEWIVAIQQLNNFYNKRMDTGQNGTSDLIVPSQPYTPLRVIEEGMESTGCPIPAAYQRLHTDSPSAWYNHYHDWEVRRIIHAGGGIKDILDPKTGYLMTLTEAEWQLNFQPSPHSNLGPWDERYDLFAQPNNIKARVIKFVTGKLQILSNMSRYDAFVHGSSNPRDVDDEARVRYDNMLEDTTLRHGHPFQRDGLSLYQQYLENNLPKSVTGLRQLIQLAEKVEKDLDKLRDADLPMLNAIADAEQAAIIRGMNADAEEETPGTWIDTRLNAVQEAIWRGTGGFNLELRHPITDEIVTEYEAIESLNFIPDENTGVYPFDRTWDDYTNPASPDTYRQTDLARELSYMENEIIGLYYRKVDDPSIDIDKYAREMYHRFSQKYLIPSADDSTITQEGWHMPSERILALLPTRVTGAAGVMSAYEKIDQFEDVLRQEDQEVLKAILEAEANAIEAGQQNVRYYPSAMRGGGRPIWSNLTPEQQAEWREEAEAASQAKRDEWIRAIGRGPNYMEQDLWEIIMPSTNWAAWNLPFPRGGQVSSPLLQERWQGRQIPLWLKVRAFAVTPEGQAMNRGEIAKELGVGIETVHRALQGYNLHRARGQYQYYGPPIQVRMDERTRRIQQTRMERGFQTAFGELPPEDLPWEYVEQRNADIIRLHGEGKINEDIIREVGVDRGVVHKALKDAGLTPNIVRGRGRIKGIEYPIEAQIEEARRLRAEGLTYREIGERLGLSQQTVWYHLQKPSAMRRRGNPSWSTLTPEQQEEWREEAEQATQAKRDEWIRAVGRGPNYMEQDLWDIVIPKGNWASWSLPFPRGGQISSPMLQERWKEQKIPNWLKIRAFAVTPEGQAMTRTEIAKELGVAAPNVSTALQGFFLNKPTGRYNYYGPPIEVRMDERFRRGQQTRIEHGYSTPFGEMPPEDEPLEYIEQRNTDILRLHGEGISANRIAQEMGVVREVVRKVLEDAGLTPNPHMRKSGRPRNAPLTEVQLEEMRRLRAEGLSYRAIAERLEISRRAVWEHFLKPASWFNHYDSQIQRRIDQAGGLIVKHPDTGREMGLIEVAFIEHYDYHSNPTVNPYGPEAPLKLQRVAKSPRAKALDGFKSDLSQTMFKAKEDQSAELNDEIMRKDYEGLIKFWRDWPKAGRGRAVKEQMQQDWERYGHLFPEEITGWNQLRQLQETIEREQKKLLDSDRKLHIAVMEAEDELLGFNAPNTPSAWLGSMETPPEFDKDIFDFSFNEVVAETEGTFDIVHWQGRKIGPPILPLDVAGHELGDMPKEWMEEEGYTEASANWDIGDIHVSLDKGPWRNPSGEKEVVAQVTIETMVDAGDSGSGIFGAEGQIKKINELLRQYQQLNPGIRVIANARGEQHPESGRARGRGDIRARVYERYGWKRLPEGRTMGGGILMELPPPVEDDIPSAFSGVSQYANEIMELVG